MGVLQLHSGLPSVPTLGRLGWLRCGCGDSIVELCLCTWLVSAADDCTSGEGRVWEVTKQVRALHMHGEV